MYKLDSQKLTYFPLGLNNWRYYLFTLFFVGGNMFFPWLVHNIPFGGPKFLPIYFFVLIGGYKFGWQVGVSTSILSPLANHFLTGMPPYSMILPIFIKGIIMAIIASSLALKTKKVSFSNLAIIILGYQSIGLIFEWLSTANLNKALQDFIIGYPGLLIQFFGGYIILLLLKDYGQENKQDVRI